jgi:hypothetical protein
MLIHRGDRNSGKLASLSPAKRPYLVQPDNSNCWNISDPATNVGSPEQIPTLVRSRSPKRGFEGLADEALVGHAGLRCGGLHGVEQRFRQPHVDALALRLELKAHQPHAREIEIGQVRLDDEAVGRFIGIECW